LRSKGKYHPDRTVDLQKIRRWFQHYVAVRFPGARVRCLPRTDKTKLSKALEDEGLMAAWPACWTWEMTIDVAVTFICGSSTNLLLANVMERDIRIRDIGEMVAYCIVARPALGFLVSTFGLSASVSRLLWKNDRLDVLRYGDKGLHILKWDRESQQATPLV